MENDSLHTISGEIAVVKQQEIDNKSRERKDSQVDLMFCQSLRGFKTNLLSTYALAFQSDVPNVTIKYKDLINSFEKIMNTVCKETMADSQFPVNMGVNAFRGFIDRFIEEKQKRPQNRPFSKKKKRHRRKKKQKRGEEIYHGTHNFVSNTVYISTQCEVCNSLLWPSVKALTCQKCRAICHTKCYMKVEPNCSHNSAKARVISAGSLSETSNSTGKLFSVPLENLVTDIGKIPGVIERLITKLELYGLYTEGLYRKCGAATEIRRVKALMEKDPDGVSFDNVPVHVMTVLLKQFLREMPEPLLTFNAYDSILSAALLPDEDECLHEALATLRNLPTVNYVFFERLVVHLARVTLHEEHNRMNSSALAIIFTPCILRNSREIPVNESLQHISQQTQVIDLIVSKQTEKMRTTLKDIAQVDHQAATAGEKLRTIRQTKQARLGSTDSLNDSADQNSGNNVASNSSNSLPPANSRADPREALAEYRLKEKLADLENERHKLEQELPELVRTNSEEDVLSTDLSRASSLDDLPTASVFQEHTGTSSFPVFLSDSRNPPG